MCVLYLNPVNCYCFAEIIFFFISFCGSVFLSLPITAFFFPEPSKENFICVGRGMDVRSGEAAMREDLPLFRLPADGAMNAENEDKGKKRHHHRVETKEGGSERARKFEERECLLSAVLCLIAYLLSKSFAMYLFTVFIYPRTATLKGHCKAKRREGDEKKLFIH